MFKRRHSTLNKLLFGTLSCAVIASIGLSSAYANTHSKKTASKSLSTKVNQKTNTKVKTNVASNQVPQLSPDDYPPPFRRDSYNYQTERLFDYNTTQKSALRQKFSQLLKGANVSINIVQFGDSHTAGDFFTDRVRKRLQAYFGQGSIGWMSPMRVHAQRNALIDYHSSNWELKSSRTQDDPNFPMGGYIASPTGPNAELTITPKEPIYQIVPINILVRRTDPSLPQPVIEGALGATTTTNIPADGRWHNTLVILQPPLTFRASVANQYQLGGVWINDKSSGVSLSAVGLNGAQQMVWNKWRADWMKVDLAQYLPDIIIISYGTNEAFNDELDLNYMKTSFTNGVRELKKDYPNALIVIIGAPDSLRTYGHNTMYCDGHRPANLDPVKITERNVAIDEHTLYWDWQAAMGGKCSMVNWKAQHLAGKDGVHFTESGYYKAADIFVDDFMKWLGFDPRTLPSQGGQQMTPQ